MEALRMKKEDGSCSGREMRTKDEREIHCKVLKS